MIRRLPPRPRPGRTPRRGSRPAAAVALLAILLGAPPVAAQTDPADAMAAGRAAAARGEYARAYERFLEAWDPGRDDPSVLAALAGAAAASDALADLRDRLAPTVAADPAAAHAARFWVAAALQTGVPADSVRATLERRVEARPGDVAALTGYVRVWIGHRGFEAAESLLDVAASLGAPAVAVAVLRGEAREAAGDPVGALEAYAAAVVDGGGDMGGGDVGESLRRAERLLGSWPGGPPPADAVAAVSEALDAAEGSAASALAPLAVRAGIAAGDWSAAIEAAGHPALRPAERAASLRAVATVARAAGAPAPARAAAEALLALGPPYARPGDRNLLTDGADPRGDIVGEDAWRAAGPTAGPVGAAAEALQRGDREALAAALDAPAAGGIDPSVLAVPRGDLWLARGRPDSAMAAWERGIEAGTSRPAGLAALGRARLLQALAREGARADDLARVGEALLSAPAEPAGAAGRLRALAEDAAARDSAGVAAAILEGLAAEWEGREGDPAGASRSLERAARAAPAEAPPLLLAAGRWAARADESERARALWREVALDHPTTPYALEARRLLAEEGAR